MNFLICFYILMILVGICMPTYGRRAPRPKGPLGAFFSMQGKETPEMRARWYR
jgi:hypothetical protein